MVFRTRKMNSLFLDYFPESTGCGGGFAPTNITTESLPVGPTVPKLAPGIVPACPTASIPAAISARCNGPAYIGCPSTLGTLICTPITGGPPNSETEFNRPPISYPESCNISPICAPKYDASASAFPLSRITFPFGRFAVIALKVPLCVGVIVRHASCALSRSVSSQASAACFSRVAACSFAFAATLFASPAALFASPAFCSASDAFHSSIVFFSREMSLDFQPPPNSIPSPIQRRSQNTDSHGSNPRTTHLAGRFFPNLMYQCVAISRLSPTTPTITNIDPQLAKDSQKSSDSELKSFEKYENTEIKRYRICAIFMALFIPIIALFFIVCICVDLWQFLKRERA